MSELKDVRKPWEIRRDEIFGDVKEILSKLTESERTKFISPDTYVVNNQGITYLLEQLAAAGKNYQRNELEGISTEHMLFPVQSV